MSLRKYFNKKTAIAKDSIKVSSSKKGFLAYDVINNLVVGKNIDLLETHAQQIKPFLINRMLGDDSKILNLSYAMSVCHKMPDQYQYMFYTYTIPRQKFYRTKYRNLKDKDYQQQIFDIQQYHQCNKNKAIEFYSLYTADDITQIQNINKQRSDYGRYTV